jgi:hypothetical protein
MSRRRLAVIAVVAVLALLFGGRLLAMRYSEYLWYAEQGLQGRFWTDLLRSLFWQSVTFVVAAAWYCANTLAVYRTIGSVQLPQRIGNLVIAEAVPGRVLRAVALAVGLLLAFATVLSFSDLHRLVALFRHGGQLDPFETILERDAGFYLTRVPLLETIHVAALLSVFIATLVTIGLYAVTGSLSVSGRKLSVTQHVRTHLVILATALALVTAWGFHLDTLRLVGGGGGAEGALTPVDRSVRLPASTALGLVALVVAVGTGLALRWARPGVVLAMWATLGLATLIGRVLVPVLAEAWSGNGDPAVEHSLATSSEEFTRAAFGLQDIREETLAVRPEPLPDARDRLEAALSGVSAWSGEPGLLESALTASGADSARGLGWTVSVDRLSEEPERLVAIAVSQVDPLAAMRAVPRPSWTELHRRASAWGRAVLAVDPSPRAGALLGFSSLSPLDSAPLTGTLPSLETEASQRMSFPASTAPLVASPIRFSPRAVDLAVIGPGEATLEEPVPGVLLKGFSRRLLLAWALQSPPLLGKRTSEADRVLFWRELPSRLTRLYPFASFDPARAVLAGRELLWVSDGYLASSRFPLSRQVRWRGEAINFLSSPYIATVHAATGETRLYLRPGANGFAATLARGEGFQPLPPESLPDVVRRRLQYPLSLFVAQAAVLARRGADSGRGRETWRLAAHDSTGAAFVERAGDLAQVRPTLALLSLGEEPPSLWRLLPLTDNGGNVLVGFVAGTVSSDGRLVLRLLRVPAGFPTPAAAANRLASSPALLAAAAGASGPSGLSRRSQLHVVPAAGSVAYIQMLFATEDRTREPMEIKAVAVLAGGRVGVGLDAATAVGAMERGEVPRGDPGLARTLEEARAAFDALDSAMRRGDWSAFARAYQNLRRALGGGQRP